VEHKTVERPGSTIRAQLEVADQIEEVADVFNPMVPALG
jgi:hypothetical protein